MGNIIYWQLNGSILFQLAFIMMIWSFRPKYTVETINLVIPGTEQYMPTWSGVIPLGRIPIGSVPLSRIL